MTSAITDTELALARALIAGLNLDELDPASVDPQAPLFGNHSSGWGLDSIDALEIALIVKQQYGVELRSDDEDDKAAFASLRALNEHVERRRQTVTG